MHLKSAALSRQLTATETGATRTKSQRDLVEVYVQENGWTLNTNNKKRAAKSMELWHFPSDRREREICYRSDLRISKRLMHTATSAA